LNKTQNPKNYLEATVASFNAKFEKLKLDIDRLLIEEEKQKLREQHHHELLVCMICEQLVGAHVQLAQQFDELVTQLENQQQHQPQSSPPDLIVTNNRRPPPPYQEMKPSCSDTDHTNYSDQYQWRKYGTVGMTL
jgi:hypothetical protein